MLSLDSSLVALRSTKSRMKSRIGRPSKRAYSSCTTLVTCVGSTPVIRIGLVGAPTVG